MLCAWASSALSEVSLQFENFGGLSGMVGSISSESWKSDHAVLYLSAVYIRGEMELRIGLVYTAASRSGAFEGSRSLLIDQLEEMLMLRFLGLGLAQERRLGRREIQME